MLEVALKNWGSFDLTTKPALLGQDPTIRSTWRAEQQEDRSSPFGDGGRTRVWKRRRNPRTRGLRRRRVELGVETGTAHRG